MQSKKMIQEAIILAGGLGTRLRSVVSDLPKPMAPVAGRPFLEYLLEYWMEQGVERFILSVSHLHQKISGHFGTEWRGCPIAYSVEAQPLGTGGAIVQALSLVHGTQVWVGNGDTFVDVDLAGMAKFHLGRSGCLTLATTRVISTARYSALEIGEDQKIRGFVAKGQDAPGQINAGVYALEKNIFLLQAPPSERFSWEGDYLPALIKSGAPVLAFAAGDRFLDIGIPTDYARAESFLHG